MQLGDLDRHLQALRGEFDRADADLVERFRLRLEAWKEDLATSGELMCDLVCRSFSKTMTNMLTGATPHVP